MSTDEDLYHRLNQARTLSENGHHSEALTEFLYFIDNKSSLGNFGRANMQFILSEIIELADYVPEATEKLASIRDRWEELILAGDGDWSYLHDVHILNERLGQPERDLILLDQLSSLGLEYSELHQKFLIVAWMQLARAGRYEDVASCIETRAQEIAGHMARTQVQWEFAKNSEQRESEACMLQYLLPTALLAYETLLVLGKDVAASKLAKWVFDCEPLAEAPVLFIAAANKIGRRDVAEALAQARKSVPIAQNSGNAAAVSPVPNSGETSQDFEGDTP